LARVTDLSAFGGRAPIGKSFFLICKPCMFARKEQDRIKIFF
jgi:hypothetical protein